MSSGLWVVNASPVIALAKIQQLRLVEMLSHEVIVPEAVAAEIAAGPVDDPARIAIREGWGRRAAPITMSQRILEWGLGAGETQVLALTMERSPATAVLDDSAARTAARVMGVPMLGTLGLIFRARRKGLLDSAAKVIADLKAVGFHMDDRLVRTVLRHVGENPI